uniref:SERRATE/Ars2 C-terminal domain-containing protein n=1 Tax=Knipowitschia caucasica TaxID=637954 RepID=A0AAV2J8E2_KNICA
MDTTKEKRTIMMHVSVGDVFFLVFCSLVSSPSYAYIYAKWGIVMMTVIKMEGGTDHDIRILDLPSEEEEQRDKPRSAAPEQPKKEESKTLETEPKGQVSSEDTNEKGPEFVRKHILNKHGDKIEEVKKEVIFFNNFLMDAKRPSLPELKMPPLPGPAGAPPYPPNQYGGGRGNYDNFRGGGGGGYLGKPRNLRMSRGDPRNIIEYRDLDAPEDVDDF